MRTQKVDSTGTQNYVMDGSSPASPVLKDGNAVYTPGLSEHRGSASKFYHGDALGSTRGITDSTQAVTDSQLYDAFGQTVSRTGTTPTPFGFVGKAQYQSDSDSGLQLLGHRYYDPSLGRFLSSDPIQAGTNWYAYCDNNPLDETDAQGLDGNQVPGPYGPGSKNGGKNIPNGKKIQKILRIRLLALRHRPDRCRTDLRKLASLRNRRPFRVNFPSVWIFLFGLFHFCLPYHLLREAQD